MNDKLLFDVEHIFFNIYFFVLPKYLTVMTLYSFGLYKLYIITNISQASITFTIGIINMDFYRLVWLPPQLAEFNF